MHAGDQSEASSVRMSKCVRLEGMQAHVLVISKTKKENQWDKTLISRIGLVNRNL